MFSHPVPRISVVAGVGGLVSHIYLYVCDVNGLVLYVLYARRVEEEGCGEVVFRE